MEFEKHEKLAMVWAIQSVMFADGEVSVTEHEYLTQLMKVFDFDINFVEEAIKMDGAHALWTLKNFDKPKQTILAMSLTEMAKADGEIDYNEGSFLITTVR